MSIQQQVTSTAGIRPLPVAEPLAESKRVRAARRPAPGGPASYAELKARIRDAGLMDSLPGYYLYKSLTVLAPMALSLSLLALRIPFALQLLNAAFLALIFTQIGFLFHDICHRALARGNRQNLLLGLFFGNLLTGISRAWWTDNHNAHHAHPNEVGEDPNIEIPVLAFTEEQALAARGPARWVIKHQRWFLFPIFCLQGFNMIVQSFAFVIRSRDVKLFRLELPLLVLHQILYVAVLLVTIGPIEGICFALVHLGLVGLYAGSVFAPNHKGMPVVAAGTQVGFLEQQVLTARNVTASPLTDYWYGGLNYQIEHHLFPNLPRRNLGAAQQIVKTFCAEHGIAYHETGMVASYREILAHLAEISTVLQ